MEVMFALVDKELLEQEIAARFRCNFNNFKKVRLCKKFILWLFTCFDCGEMIELWYDSEGEDRIKRLTWEEPTFEGNWNLTQLQVNKAAANTWWRILSSPISKSGRLWQAKQPDGTIFLYWYGRDFEGAKVGFRDYCFVYKPKGVSSDDECTET